MIHAPADVIYRIVADYRNQHPQILPKRYFLSLDVEEGGFGAGTVVNFEMRLLGQRQSFHSLITEPEPGHLLVETDIKSGIKTSFRVSPTGDKQSSEVTISTELTGRNFVEGFIARMLLQKVYVEELELLSRLAEEQAGTVEQTHRT